MTEAVTVPALLQLMTWLSPAFPVGAFAYSHGLETAIQSQLITDKSEAQDYLHDLIEHGSGWNDALLLAAAWRAVHHEQGGELNAVNELALALCPGHERYLETTLQGDAFLKAAKPWGADSVRVRLQAKDIAYPVAIGALAKSSGIGESASVAAYLHGFCSNLVAVMMRLVPLGQSDGMAIMAHMSPHMEDVAIRVTNSTLDDLGNVSFYADFLAIAHEHQETRIFKS
ncbi:Urease accessory protein UreF [Pseudovibrio axinellae]|uniref:Urease accessory protein UreF n=1 Tax=Pseudovibrio axinellae TaxID=989403 RepID=A0A166BCI2_9HYPH|nr:urease accessory protein UreF [Pseudovibrio axinellae]KZL22123.1 Urease accessory protein UreF [Pseudovibrio axinellae]SEQ54353.1 urease accessory protein [Pseudovibrio axinellae]